MPVILIISSMAGIEKNPYTGKIGLLTILNRRKKETHRYEPGYQPLLHRTLIFIIYISPSSVQKASFFPPETGNGYISVLVPVSVR